MAPQDRDIVDIMVGFARTLRHAGVDADASRVQSMMSALAELDVARASDAYWAGRLTLCANPDDLDRYDTTFALYFADRSLHSVHRNPQRTTELRAVPFEVDAAGSGDETARDDQSFAVRASRHEVLRHKDIATLTAAEREELHRLFVLLAPRASGRRTRRFRPSATGGLDMQRSVRRMIRSGGEPSRLDHHRRRIAPRRLVILIDVSGSMTPYADALLRFGHASVRARPGRTEVFTVGTRLTRVTRQLRNRDPERALAGAGSAVPDWSGGTRLGETLKAFSDRWGQRGVARGSVVVLCSDGWERGDPTTLGEQVARLRRLAHAVVWVNPHKGKYGFAPATGGMAAALPHLDALVAGHNLAALEELIQVIADA